MDQNTSQFNQYFMKNYNEESGAGYFLEVNVQVLEKLHELHKGLPFLLERMKIRKFEKLVAILRDKTECVTHIRNLKQTLNRGLVWKQFIVHIGISTDLKKRAKNDFEKDFVLSWWIMQFFRKIIENVKKIVILNLLKQKKEETI